MKIKGTLSSNFANTYAYADSLYERYACAYIHTSLKGDACDFMLVTVDLSRKWII